MYRLCILVFLFVSATAFSSEKYLFNMSFSMTHKDISYRYQLNFYEGIKGIVVKSKLNGEQKTHYVQTMGKQHIIARTPKDLIDRPLFYIYRISKNEYKLQYPINMNDSKWDKFIFNVKGGEARSRGVLFSQLKVGKTVFDTYWGFRVPVGVERIDIK